MKGGIFSIFLVGIFPFFISTTNSIDEVWKMVIEYSEQHGWNHMILISADGKGILSPSVFKKIFYYKSGVSIISRVNLDSYMSIGKENEEMADLNLTTPIYKKQFICSWDTSLVTYLEKAGEKGFFTTQQNWLILLTENQTIEEIKSKLTGVPFYIDSEVIVSQYNFDEEKWQLFEIWKIGPGTVISENLIGEWSQTLGLKLRQLPHKYIRRKDMKGFHLRVATIKTMPYESLLEDATLQNFDSGYVVDIWHTLQEQLNFSYTATNTLFGSLQKDGVTWNGMVGMLQTDDADVAVAPLSITQIRSFSIDFTIPIQIVSTRIYIRRPALEATWVLYYLPFDDGLWICVPCFVVFTAFWLWALNKFALYCSCEAEEISPSNAFWAMFSSLVQQSTAVEPKPFSSKFMFVAGFLSSLILYTCYAAILVSILATMKPHLPFRDFRDLRQKQDWNVGVRTNTALADALALSPKGSPRRDAWDNQVTKDPVRNLPTNNDDALKSVLEGKYAFFANKEYIIYRLQRILPLKDAVNIVDTGRDFLVRGIGFGVQKNSPVQNIFNFYLSKMTSRGHLHRLKQKWWPKISREPDPIYPSPGLQEVFTVFLIFGIGIISSLIFLGVEKLTGNKKLYDNQIEALKK